MKTRSNIDLTQTGISGANLGNGNQVFSNVTNGVKLNFRTLVASGSTKLITNGNSIIISGATVGAGSGDITNGGNRGSVLGAGVFSVKSGTTLTFKSISSSNSQLIKIINDPGNIYISGATVTANVAGSNQQIQYNNNGVFGANSNFKYDSTGCTLTIANGATSSIGTNNIINKSSIHGNNNLGIGCATICGNSNITNVTAPFSFSGNSNMFLGTPSNSLNSCNNVFNGTGSLNNASYGISIGANNIICRQILYNVVGCGNSLINNSVGTARDNFIFGETNNICGLTACNTVFGVCNVINAPSNAITIFGVKNNITCGNNISLISSVCNNITGSSGCYNYSTFASTVCFNSNSLPALTNYSCHLFTGNLALICTPLSGSTSNDYLLSWNPTDRKVKRLNVNSVGGGGGFPAGINNNIQFNKNNTFGADTKFNYVCSGTTMTIGNTYQSHTNCSILVGGAGSLNSTCANLNLSIGDGLVSDKTNYSLNIGSSNQICNLSTTSSNYDFVFGFNNSLTHNGTPDLNHNYRTILNGCCNTIGCISRGAIINSNDSIICYSNNRAILNSSNVCLFDNTPAAQGSHITALSLNNFCLNSLSSYNYGCHLITGNLAIACTPQCGIASDNILVWNNADKKVKIVPQINLGWSNLLNGSTIIGCGTVLSASTINCNTFYGVCAGSNITTNGCNNVANGFQALTQNDIGNNNVANGTQALRNNTCGSNNVSVGYQALYNNTCGNNNIGVGVFSLHLNTCGGSNISIGNFALENNIGNSNIAHGLYALNSNTTGCGNIGMGVQSFFSNITGIDNIGVGSCAGYFNNGSSNVMIGCAAGYCNVGSSNVMLGYRAGYFETGSNKLIISNSNTCTPLFYGEFDNNRLKINGTLEIVNGIDNFIYLGDKNTDNSWRFDVSGSNLLIQRRISGVWTTKSTITG